MPAKIQMAVGSVPWIQTEKENVVQLLEQEKEELVYPAQHAMEWLNEHMGEIFSKSQFNVTDVFKTPGKLRGKTPRTARKRPALDSRIPLSDIFSSMPHNVASPRSPLIPETKRAKFEIAQDVQPATKHQETDMVAKKYTDSGYHGSTEDEMEIDTQEAPSNRYEVDCQPQQKESISPMGKNPPLPDSAEGRTTEGSFHSAKEDMTAKTSSTAPPTEAMDIDAGSPEPVVQPINKPNADSSAQNPEQLQGHQNNQRVDLVQELDDIGSPSDGSTPDRPLMRKSSLTFATLPAREPLNAKKSFGVRISQIDHNDPPKHTEVNHYGTLAESLRITNADVQEGLQTNQQISANDSDEKRDEVEDVDMVTENHHKSTTQRLQEKIDMLGKSQPSRASKSIPSAAALAAFNLRKSEAAQRAAQEITEPETELSGNWHVEEDDDWIKPLAESSNAHRPALIKSHTTEIMENIVSPGADVDEDDDRDEMEWDMRAPELIAHEERMRTPVRMSPTPRKPIPNFGHVKSASTVTLASPGKAAMGPAFSHAKTVSVSNLPNPTTTPKGSPHRYFNAPLSASKSKLQSIMKTAKGLFSSSAGVSAAAKMETLSPSAMHMAAKKMPGLYPSIMDVADHKPLPPSPPKNGRRTRSSTEREKEEKRKDRERRERTKAEEQLEKVRQMRKQQVTQLRAEERVGQEQASVPVQTLRKSPRRVAEEPQEVEKATDGNEQGASAISSVQNKAQRPLKPTREMPKKNRPQPMSIRVGSTLSQRMPMNNSTMASNLQDNLPPTNPKPAVVSKKPSNPSLNTGPSHPGFNRTASSQPGKPRALLAAERKKEADEREAQRKLDQKRETERKRAAQQEESRRAEQRQRAEIERRERDRVAAEQVRKAAQQQAIDKKRQEQAKKLEQQRMTSAAQDPPSSFQNASAAPRGDAGPGRPPSRLGATSTLSRSIIAHNLPTNPAKPPKRVHEEEAGPSRPQAAKYGAASQHADAKRRRTEDEEILEPVIRPTMSGAPVRQSNMNKKPTVFPLGYGPTANAPQMIHQAQPQAHVQFQQPQNPYRAAHQTDTSKYANGNKIPFADAPNPPAPAHQQQGGQQQPQQHHKTPSSSQHPKSTLTLVKSSPQYTPGENIHLPEIPTDSEDEDSSNSDSQASPNGGANGSSNFPVPSWASPTTLTNQLLAQESIDGDAVFGPIAPLRMEEIFAKGSSKDRLKRFRDRTSSANWAVSGDGLTEREVKEDREMRERMRTMGGWRYGVS